LKIFAASKGECACRDPYSKKNNYAGKSNQYNLTKEFVGTDYRRERPHKNVVRWKIHLKM
jgi:hypothetical protein